MALLHGLYVHPSHQGRGLGTRLLDAVHDEMRRRGHLKAVARVQKTATGFFRSRGYVPADESSRYPAPMEKMLV